jgi:hypothetical protein
VLSTAPPLTNPRDRSTFVADQSVASQEPEFKPAERIQRTAVHEAGHAVIGRVLKQVCGHASVQPSPDEGEAGHTITADPYVTLGYWLDVLGRWRGKDPMVSIMRGRVMTYMAGRAAEEEFFGSCAGGDAMTSGKSTLCSTVSCPAMQMCRATPNACVTTRGHSLGAIGPRWRASRRSLRNAARCNQRKLNGRLPIEP